MTNRLAEFKERERGINVNTDLSTEGKTKAMSALKREREAYRSELHGDLKISWDAWKVRAQRNLDHLKKAEAEAAEGWDYSRLNYTREAIRSQIATATSLGDVVSLYENAKDSGDTHARRVWVESVSEAVKTRFGRELDAQLFINRLEHELDEVLSTPRIKELRAEGSKLTHEAVSLNEQTEQARRFYNPGGNGPFGTKDEFETLRDGVTITSRVNIENMATITTVDLV